MKKKFFSILLAAAMTASCINISFVHAAAQIPAFPGAEGGGMYATGGRGGTVVHVTNLNDSGTGSFRDAVSHSNRIVVFDVGGTINLKSDVVVSGNVTVAGQTAPGGAGVTLRNGKIGMGGDNIIIRFISSRPGEKGSGDYDAWGGSKGSNSIIDHCSIGWANDEQFGLYSNNMNQTVQYSLIGPSNCVSYHSKGEHGFGAMFGKGQNTWHHNMIAHSRSRNFRGKTEKTESMDFVNNVIYNWGNQTAYGTFGHLNYVNNYLKAGPSTQGSYRFISTTSGSNYDVTRFYLTGNKIVDKTGSETNNSTMAKVNANNWNGGVDYGNSGYAEDHYRSDTPFAVKDVNGNNASYVSKAETPEKAFDNVIKYAGAGISSDKRPKIDQQVMEEARTGTGSLTGGRDFSTVTNSTMLESIQKYGIQYADYNSYYPAAITTKEIVDSDNDGMPDDWERARGLNPNNASDSKSDYLGQGYTNIEYYINDLTVDAFPEGIVTKSPALVDLGPEYTTLQEDLATVKVSPTSIKSASDLTLPQKGSRHNTDIVWTSSSSAIKLKNNQVNQVNRKAADQNVTLTATMTLGDYTMNKSFSVTVIGSSASWKANNSNDKQAAGTVLFDGLTTLFDMSYSTRDVTINGETFSGYVTSSNDGKFADGKATGTAFKYVASENGYLTAYVVDLGNSTAAKTLYITEEGAASGDDCIASTSKKDGVNTLLSAYVETGKTYYIYVAGSKGRFVGIDFSANPKTLWWKATKTVSAGEELMENLTPSEELSYKEYSQTISGESFGGYVAGTNNPGDNGATGAALRYIPDSDGTFVMYGSLNNTKTAKINDADGNIIASYANTSESPELISLSGELKKGVTYYAYAAGSKMAIYGVSFTPTKKQSSAPTTAPTADPTDAPTIEPTTEPTSGPTVEPTIEPTPIPTAEPIIPTEMPLVICSEYLERVTSAAFKVDNSGNAELSMQTMNEDDTITEEASVYVAYFDEHGRFSGVEIIKANKNGSFEFKIKDESYKVMLWDTGIMPIINAITNN